MGRRIITISHLTFREAMRSKVFYSVLAFLALHILIATPYAYATIGEPINVVKNFGLAAASLGSIAAVIISGSTFLQKELSKKTIHLLLARPLRRWELLVGKCIGLSMVGSALLILMIWIIIGYAAALEGAPDWRLLWMIPYGICELLIISAVVIFFSTIVVSPVLNGIGGTAIFVAGRSQEWLTGHAVSSVSNPVARVIGSALRLIIPDLSSLQVGNGLIYNELPNVAHATLSGVYAGMYGVALLSLAAGVFQWRDIQ